MPINMSYCRFENTLAALRECRDALDGAGLDPFAELSDEEREAAQKLLKLCAELAENYGED